MERDKGFPPGARYIPAPSLLFSSLLGEITPLARLKCTLRVLAMAHLRRDKRLWVTQEELLADPVLHKGLSQEKVDARGAILQGLSAAVERGTLLQAHGPYGEALFLVNDSPGRKAFASLQQGAPALLPEGPEGVEGEKDQENGEVRPTIFALYEENIGLLTPILAQELEDAERTYPPAWIAQAFREAAARNRRNWRYIQRILERWASQGRGPERSEGTDHGEPWRHTQETDRKEYLRRYGHLAPWADDSGTRS
jgi:DnaD/phage-associated family protein